MCGIAQDQTAWCWGHNRYGQLGTGGTSNEVAPTWLGPTRWRQLAAGGTSIGTNTAAGHTCGIQLDGSLWCWGANSRGQLGVGTLIDRIIPRRVGSDLDWQLVRVGDTTTCAIKTDGSLWCWGDNEHGMVPDGSAWRTEPRVVY